MAVWGSALPFLMNTAGWLLTESGRQPWIVQGIMLTRNGISPTVGTPWLWISIIAFVGLYGALGTVDLVLMEGFDFGVGLLHGVVGSDDIGRRAVINTIGPLWDGNKVRLIVAGAGMFAAFPGWYATMFSAST